jgi:predicted ArsR family transcriptional regulator
MGYTFKKIGHAGTDTSIEAAEKIEVRAGSMRAQVLDYLTKAPAPRSADEIAAALGHDMLAIRPRITELRKAGMIVDSGERGKNKSGRKAILWELVRT